MSSRREAYLAKLRDPRWQRLRLQVFERDEWTCEMCSDTETTLNVHHRYYIDGKEPWEYPIESLVTLCEDCHEMETQDIKDATHDIVLSLKKRFFAGQIFALRDAFDRIDDGPSPWTVTRSLSHWLRNPELMHEMVVRYHEWLELQHPSFVESEVPK